MLHLAKPSTTNHKNTSLCDLQFINVNRAQILTAQSTTSCLYITRRKYMWIIFSSIAIILIISGITIPTIIITMNKANTKIGRIPSSINITLNTKWTQYATTIAGGYGEGEFLYHLPSPYGIYVDHDDRSIYIAEWGNHRIIEFKYNSEDGQVVAGGNGKGNRTNQLNSPTNVIIDKNNDSFIICDRGNRRVVRWSRRNGRNGQIIISKINCYGLTMDNNGDLYVSDMTRNAVRRWRQRDTNGIIVAGGNGQGNSLNQLGGPTYIFVDQNYSIYVSENFNNRVTKWLQGANEGIVVAGGQGEGDNLTQLNTPHGVIVDQLDSVYVADYRNDRIMRWSKGSTEGSIVVGGNGQGKKPNQFNCPTDLSFDREYNLYVADKENHRVQKFNVN